MQKYSLLIQDATPDKLKEFIAELEQLECPNNVENHNALSSEEKLVENEYLDVTKGNTNQWHSFWNMSPLTKQNTNQHDYKHCRSCGIQ